jgi:hypothetical protein
LPGHIFDANTLRNFALIDQLPLLPRLCPGTLYRAGIVRDELHRGPAGFERSHRSALWSGDPDRILQYTRFQALEAQLRALGFSVMSVTTNVAHEEALDLFHHCVDVELMDEGEAESLALAALKDLVFYTDDFQAKEAVLAYNAGTFRFPPFGRSVALHRPIPVHSSAWLLDSAVQAGLLGAQDAEAHFLAMRAFWDRHPRQTLTVLKAGPPHLWW